MRQCRSTGGGTLGTTDITVEISMAVLRKPRFQQLQAAENTCQQIVKVMRNAAGELADGLHFLALPQGFLGGPQRLLGAALRSDIAANGLQ